jgi:prepilin-type N-terminal cleavage/methylation domain-containing protein
MNKLKMMHLKETVYIKYDIEQKGFTLIELMMAVAIIAVLIAIALPNYASYRKRAKMAAVVSDFKYFEKGFISYALAEGDYPADSHIVLPDASKMSDYINPEIWGRSTPFGGTYNWEGPDSYPYAGISMFEVTAPEEDLAMLDRVLDDGNLTSGRFRLTSNGRYTYIIEE